MSDEPIDFSALDPTRDRDRFDAVVAAIVERAAPGLAGRRPPTSVLGQIARWWRPMVAAAALTGIVSVGTLARIEPATGPASSAAGIAEAIGMPAQVAEWVASDEAPTAAEILLSLEGVR